MQLVIGTKAWSTWSMRPWLVARRAGLAFDEIEIQLRQDDNQSAAEIAPYSPSGLVPTLRDGELVVVDSLAICEYLAEQAPALWPVDREARALARAAAAEMHSGFAALRRECPMDLAAEPAPLTLSDGAGKDVRRIVALWSGMLTRFGGPFLAGDWSIADAFYTPVATRFRTYAVDLAAYGDEGAAADYAARLLATPEFRAWEAAALSGGDSL